MMFHYFNEYFDLIEESPLLQMDGAICELLGKTPAQICQLEKEGLLDYESKVFLWAYSRYKIKFALENSLSLF